MTKVYKIVDSDWVEQLLRHDSITLVIHPDKSSLGKLLLHNNTKLESFFLCGVEAISQKILEQLEEFFWVLWSVLRKHETHVCE